MLSLLILSAYAPLAVPIEEVGKWNELDKWLDNPPAVPPEWSQVLSGKILPRNMIIEDFTRTRVMIGNSAMRETISRFSYDSDDFPSSLLLVVDSSLHSRSSTMEIIWEKPDGEVIKLYQVIKRPSSVEDRFFITTDTELKRHLAAYMLERLGEFVPTEDIDPNTVLFAHTKAPMHLREKAVPLKGEYQLQTRLLSTEPDDQVVGVKLSIGGQVYGAFGTDSFRRDLGVGILWGAPVALGIGLSVSVFGTIIGLIAGVVSGFYGGTWKDESIQRITDFMLLLPALPILILVSLVFRIDLWQLVLWLTLFGWMGVAKISRAMALQIREEQYVEAARSIGAIDRWIILRHVAPQILTYAFAVIALSVPSVIFTEAVLSFLGLGDPGLVTWGRILYDAQLNGAAVSGYWWWVLTPGFFITLTALGFGLLGNALDKTLQPKMRLN